MQILDGKLTAQNIKEEIARAVEEMQSTGAKKPHLAAILVGDDGASITYVNAKMKDCEQVGFKSSLIHLPSTVTELQLLNKIDELNNDSDVDGFIVQLPLPKHINEKRVIQSVKPEKDVDGFHPENVGNMMLNFPGYIPATPYGIVQLIKRYGIETSGKHCVVIGRSNIVGQPVSMLLARNAYPGNCTITLCHSRTKDLKEHTLQADILICALGKPGFVTEDMVKEGVVVIDVGTTRVADKSKKSGFRLQGDVKFDEVSKKASWITPVPGGVGPMTRAMLLKNTLESVRNKSY